MPGLEVTGNGLLCSVIQQFGKVTFQIHAKHFLKLFIVPLKQTCNNCDVKLGSGDKRFYRIEREFKFEYLSKESQEILLDKTIYFQSCEVTMRSVLQRNGNVEHVLGPELVTDLLKGKNPVKIGVKL